MTNRSPRRLSTAQARRIALAAQGFAKARPESVTTRHLTATAARLQVVQIDSVNVLTRSHYLPFFSRLGPYAQRDLDALRDRAPRRLVEYWAHEASLVTPQVWPLLRHRMALSFAARARGESADAVIARLMGESLRAAA